MRHWELETVWNHHLRACTGMTFFPGKRKRNAPLSIRFLYEEEEKSKMKGEDETFDSNYNSAHSYLVRIVTKVNEIDVTRHQHLEIKGEPNSVTIIWRDGEAIRERYFDENGDAYLDIDYNDHGNSKCHSVPHQHRWHHVKDGGLVRGPAEDIKKHD